MSVLIKDMEMPESCYYCPFADGVWQKNKRCLINGEEMPRDGRNVQQNHLICPLIEAPSDDVQPMTWIPVTERLPESVCKSYLCLTDTGYHCEVRWTNNVYGLWKSDNNWGWSIADVPQYCNVTHWMSLPKPPRGKICNTM